MVELDSSVPTQDLSDMPKGGKGQQDLSNMMVKREKIYEELRKEKEKGIHEKKKIKTVIFNVSDARWIRLFTLRYLDLKDWMEVSKEMKYAIRHIHRMHKKALDNLVVNTKK